METLLLGLVLLWSLYTVLARLMPRGVAAWRSAAAAWLVVRGAPRLAARVAPAVRAAGCDGCNGCSGSRCHTPSAPAARIPLRPLP